MKQLMVFLAMMAALFQTKFKAAEDDTNLTAAQNLQIDNYAPTYNEPADNRHRNGSQKGFAGLLKDMIMVMWRTFASQVRHITANRM